MPLFEWYITFKDFVSRLFFKNKRFRIIFGPAKGLIWINSLRPNINFNLGLWEHKKQFAMKRLVSKGMTAYDLGAYHGYFTLVLSRLVGETGSVYTFEPAKENFLYLSDIVKLNQLGNVTLNMKALGEMNGKVNCAFDSVNPMGGCIVDKPTNNQVEIVSLDSYIIEQRNKKPDIVKMDIEGFEYDALKGMEKAIKLYHPIFFIDVHNAENHARCIDFLKKNGYDVEVLHQKHFPKGGFLSDILAIYNF